MGTLVEILPLGWDTPEHEDDVILLIASLPIEPEDRKRLILEWTQLVGVALTREIVEKVYGR